MTMGIVNWYAIEEAGKLALVDAGTPADWGLLEQGLKGLERTLNDVDCVLLTHAHGDHLGFAERARAEAGATVRIHEADEAMARGARSPKNEGGLTGYLFHAEAYRTLIGLTRRGAIRVPPVAEVSTFRDGEILAVPGRPRVLHTPGHTAGNCSLWFESLSVVCTGDTVVTRNPLTGRVGPQVMPTAFNQSTQVALSSLARFDGVSAAILLPGHGEPWRDGVAEAIHRAREAGAS